MMNNKKFQIYLDFGSSKLRAGAFNKKNLNEVFYTEQKLTFKNPDSTFQIKEIISSVDAFNSSAIACHPAMSPVPVGVEETIV